MPRLEHEAFHSLLRVDHLATIQYEILVGEVPSDVHGALGLHPGQDLPAHVASQALKEHIWLGFLEDPSQFLQETST